MRKTILIFCAFISPLFLPLKVNAQQEGIANKEKYPQSQSRDSLIKQNEINAYSLISYDLLSLELPPMEVLLENARKGPVTKVFEAQLEQEKRELKNVRRTWMDNIRGFASYQYGSLSNLTFLYTPDAGTYIGEHKHLYTVGATIAVPLSEIFNKANKVKKQKARIEEMVYTVERWYDDLHLKIIEEYTNAFQCMAVIGVKSEAVTIAQAQYKVTEQDFINGKADAQTLSRQKNIESNAVREYEETRADLLSAIMKLEVLTHTKIINIKR